LSGDASGSMSFSGTVDERLREIGRDLVRLGVCEKQGSNAFSFSPIFANQLMVLMVAIKAALVDPENSASNKQGLRRLMPGSIADRFKIPFLACSMVLLEIFQLNSVDDALFSEYETFCCEIIKRIKFRNPERFMPPSAP